MDEIERKTMQYIKDYVNSLDVPENEIYIQNKLLIMSCFSKAIEFIEVNAKLRQPAVSVQLPTCKCGRTMELRTATYRCQMCGIVLLE